ncbi:MAG: hypothetical protein F6K41_14760 [Symploca sp. SIO3E6]|nr:hypothetical protein [Caldora sp. SIO3E6]
MLVSDTTKNVGWVERSETQQSVTGVGLRYRYTQPTYSTILGVSRQ